MTDPEGDIDPERNDTALWVLVGVMVFISVCGLIYGLSYPSVFSTIPPHTTGSALFDALIAWRQGQAA